MQTKMNYYDSDVEAETLKLFCYIPSNVCRRRSQSFTHVLWFLCFLNDNWHKKTAWEIQIARSSHRKWSAKQGVLRNFTKFTGKHLCQSLFFKIVAGLRAATLLKERLCHRYFLVNFAKVWRTPFPTEQLRWLLQTKHIASSNNRVSLSKFFTTWWCYQSTVYWKVLFNCFLLHFRELYYNSTIYVHNLKIFL